MSAYFVLFVCAIDDICCHSFINLNFVALLSMLSIIAEITTQFSMTSRSENEAVNAATFNIFTKHFVEFERCFCSKTDHFSGNLDTNMIMYVSEIKLYNILSTLEEFECWNLTVLITNISG